MNFRIVRKGYDTKETDDYILKLTKEDYHRKMPMTNSAVSGWVQGYGI